MADNLGRFHLHFEVKPNIPRHLHVYHVDAYCQGFDEGVKQCNQQLETIVHGLRQETQDMISQVERKYQALLAEALKATKG